MQANIIKYQEILCKIKAKLELLRQFFDCIKNDSFPSPQKTCIIVCYHELILRCENCITIFDNSVTNIIAIPSIIRTMLETSVDIGLLYNESNYHLDFQLYSHVQREKYLKELIKFHEELGGKDVLETYQKLLDECRQHIACFKAQGSRLPPRSLEQKINKLGEQGKGIYATYRGLSAYTHPTIHTMMDKYRIPQALIPKFEDSYYLACFYFLNELILPPMFDVLRLFPGVNITLLNRAHNIHCELKQTLTRIGSNIFLR